LHHQTRSPDRSRSGLFVALKASVGGLFGGDALAWQVVNGRFRAPRDPEFLSFLRLTFGGQRMVSLFLLGF
jgi:hypothetical protein